MKNYNVIMRSSKLRAFVILSVLAGVLLDCVDSLATTETFIDIEPLQFQYGAGVISGLVEHEITGSVGPEWDDVPDVRYTVDPTLPSGLTINENTGIISGAPTQKPDPPVSTHTVTARGTGKYSGVKSTEVSIFILKEQADVSANFNLSYTNTSIPRTKTGTTYLKPIWDKAKAKVMPAEPTVKYSIVVNKLPPPEGGDKIVEEVKIDTNTGVLSVKISEPPQKNTSITVTVTAEGVGAYSETIIITEMEIKITDSIDLGTYYTLQYNDFSAAKGAEIASSSPVWYFQNAATVPAGDDGPTAVIYTVVAVDPDKPSLPDGLTINKHTGVISGTPTTAAIVGETTHTITATPNEGSAYTGKATADLTIYLLERKINMSELDLTYAYFKFEDTVTSAAIKRTPTWTRSSGSEETIPKPLTVTYAQDTSGNLPNWPAELTLNPSTGEISGTLLRKQGVTKKYGILATGTGGYGGEQKGTFTIQELPPINKSFVYYDKDYTTTPLHTKHTYRVFEAENYVNVQKGSSISVCPTWTDNEATTGETKGATIEGKNTEFCPNAPSNVTYSVKRTSDNDEGKKLVFIPNDNLTLNANTGKIHGMPTNSSDHDYIVTASRYTTDEKTQEKIYDGVTRTTPLRILTVESYKTLDANMRYPELRAFTTLENRRHNMPTVSPGWGVPSDSLQKYEVVSLDAPLTIDAKTGKVSVNPTTMTQKTSYKISAIGKGFYFNSRVTDEVTVFVRPGPSIVIRDWVDKDITKVTTGCTSIQSVADLKKMTSSGTYCLTSDIDLDIDSKNTLWSPLHSEGTPFTGTLHGNGYIISNLNINASNDDYQGLFAALDNATVNNLGIGIGTQGITGKSKVGALAGTARGTTRVDNVAVFAVFRTHNDTPAEIKGVSKVGGLIGETEKNVYVKGTYYGVITIDDNNYPGDHILRVSGRENVGGLVGYNNFGMVSGHVAGTVIGNNVSDVSPSNVGGLVGYNNVGVVSGHVAGTVIVNDVSDFSASNVGGLVGYNDSGMVSGHVAGTVEGKQYVGGLVGYNNVGVVSGHVAGTVKGPQSVGGLIGFNNNGVINWGYWDKAKTGQGSAIGESLGNKTSNSQGISSISNIVYSNGVYTDSETDGTVFNDSGFLSQFNLEKNNAPTLTLKPYRILPVVNDSISFSNPVQLTLSTPAKKSVRVYAIAPFGETGVPTWSSSNPDKVSVDLEEGHTALIRGKQVTDSPVEITATWPSGSSIILIKVESQ